MALIAYGNFFVFTNIMIEHNIKHYCYCEHETNKEYHEPPEVIENRCDHLNQNCEYIENPQEKEKLDECKKDNYTL